LVLKYFKINLFKLQIEVNVRAAAKSDLFEPICI
jgi:hypothetical protein